MEIGRLGRDPDQETLHSRIIGGPLAGLVKPHEFRVGEAPVHHAVTDRMNRHSLAPAPAFR